ncbi:MAG: DUF2336 domain-containing protein [Alphaproteobacteria bacterium]|nr:DUF2336 domain-containing protein [Alphaproteobacteria bacterium]
MSLAPALEPQALPPGSLAALGEGVRVRLGAAPDTAPALLHALAGDPSVMVRAAVAMNAVAPAQAHRILAADRDERVRALLAGKLAALVPTASQPDRSALAEQALAMLADLIEDEAVRVRTAIADVVKEMPQAPRELILRLAHDSALSVADPVIRLSPLLGTEDLLALLAEAPSPATATAVARRPGLQPAVADAIAASADTAAITALLANQSAAIREATLDALIARAAQNAEWHAPLVQRPSLSARAARALSEIVATQLLGVLASRGDLDPDVTRDLQRRLSQRLAPAPATHDEPTLERALARAHALLAEGRLDEETLLAAAQRGEPRLCTAMLAVAAEVPVSVVERAATLRSAKGLASLVWKAGFSMRCAEPLQVLLARLAPSAVLRGAESGRFPLAAEEMRWQLDFLQRMGR